MVTDRTIQAVLFQSFCRQRLRRPGETAMKPIRVFQGYIQHFAQGFSITAHDIDGPQALAIGEKGDVLPIGRPGG